MNSELPRRPRGRRPWTVRWHRWLGLALALPVLLCAVSGVALAWREQVWQIQHPALAAPAPRLSDAELASALRRLTDLRGPDAAARLLAPPRDGLAGWQVWFENGDRGLYSADGATLLARWDESRSLFGVLHGLHVELLAGPAGRWFLGLVGLVAVPLTVIGVLAWLRGPRRLRARELLPRRARRGPWLAAHRHWGLVISVPTLLLMVTGTLMSWSGLWRAGLPAPERLAPAASAAAPDLEIALAALRDQWPAAELRFLDVSSLDEGRLGARLRQPGEVHPNGRSALTVTLSGAVLERYDPLSAGSLARLDDLVYPLHSGRIDVAGWYWAVVISGVLLAALSVAGVLTWHASRKGTAPVRSL